VLADARLDDRDQLCARLDLPSDSLTADLIAAAYSRWGTRFPEMLTGDFAVVVLDHRDQSLLAARDAMGARPLFYRQQGGLLGLATLSRELHEAHGFGGGLDDEALLAWAHLGYDEERALFRDVFFVPPGHSLRSGRSINKVEVTPFHRFAEVAEIRYRDTRDYCRHFLDTLVTCTADRCRDASGPIGVTLSGGMDSTTVAAAAVKAGFEVRPISFRFETLADCDETARSLAVARHLGLAEPIWVDCERYWLYKGAFTDPTRHDNPFLSWDEMDDWITARLRALGGNVLLTGQGGDNLITGAGKGVTLGAQLRRGRLGALSSLRAHWREVGVSPVTGFRRHVISPMLSHAARIRAMTLIDRQHGMHPWIAVPRGRYIEMLIRTSRTERLFSHPLRQVLYEWIGPYAKGARRVIHWQHRLTRRHGVTSRHPFFDKRLAELVVAFPPELFRLGDRIKGFLRETMRGSLPSTIIDEVEKPSLLSFYHYGYRCEQDHIKKLIEISPLADRGIVDRQRLLTAFEAYLAAEKRDADAPFGTTVFTDLWLQKEMRDQKLL